jgi:hypothetical protein
VQLVLIIASSMNLRTESSSLGTRLLSAMVTSFATPFAPPGTNETIRRARDVGLLIVDLEAAFERLRRAIDRVCPLAIALRARECRAKH